MMLWFQSVLTPEGWVAGARVRVENGLIDRIDIGVEPGADDERHAVAIPGLANVHSHAFQRGMAGLAEIRGPAGDDFWTWRDVMYRFLARLGPDDVEAIAALAYAEMLERGFTRVGEFHYLHRDPDGKPYANPAELAARIAAASEETGIGLTLLPVFYAHGNFGGASPTPGQRRFLNNVDSFADLLQASERAIAPLADARLGVAPHSLRAVSPDELARVISLCAAGPIHIHAAEQIKEVDDCLAWSGARPVEWLLEHAGIDARWCIVHATHAAEPELQRLAASGAVAGLCPITEANLGDGVFPAADYHSAGGLFGLGTDSNVLIDAAGELRALEYAQRLTRRRRNVLALAPQSSTGRSIFDCALSGGAKAVGTRTPGIRVGASADIVSFDARHPSLAGRTGDAILDGWIFAGGTIDCVWRRGRKVVDGGRHLRREPIRERYLRVITRLID